MIDPILIGVLSNSLLALVLAVTARTVQVTGRWPEGAHVLWLLSIAKLVTPPLIVMPLALPFADKGGVVAAAVRLLAIPELSVPAEMAGPVDGTGATPSSTVAAAPLVAVSATYVVLSVWATGSLVVLFLSVRRLARFRARMNTASEPAPDWLQSQMREVAGGLGLRRPPQLRMTPANVPPLLWAPGVWACVVLSRRHVRELTSQQLRCVLAHELAHLARRDHLVRWLEWLAGVLFWWHPLFWWARRNLRLNEEICCDALALTVLAGQRCAYAGVLLSVVEGLYGRPAGVPELASGMSGDRPLERRLAMILSTNSPSRKCRRPLAFALALALPLGAVQAAPGDDAFGVPGTGAWRAVDRAAQNVTGDLLVAPTGLAFENGTKLDLTPVREGTRAVFAVEHAIGPQHSALGADQLCKGPITHVTMLSYHGFALALHLHEGKEAPAEPLPGTVTQIAQRGKCASYYYRAVD